MTEEYDYSRYTDSPEEAIGDNMMSVLQGLADSAQAGEEAVAALEAQLEEAKQNVKRILETEIPNILQGIEGKINLPDGRTITLSTKIRTSLSGERKERALTWIEDRGDGGIIKRRVTIEIGKDQEELSKKIKEKLKEIDDVVLYKEDRNVAWQTMDAYVKEQLKEGVAIPKELFGVYEQKITKIK